MPVSGLAAVEARRLLEVEGLRQDGDRVEDRAAGAHLNLLLACLAVGDDNVGARLVDETEELAADGL